MTVAARVVEYDPLREARHPDARAAREQADWLLWLQLGGLSPRTIADYEKATSVALRLFPHKAFDEFTDGDLIHIAATFPPAGRRTRMAGFTSWFKWGYQTRRINENPVDRLPRMRAPRQRYLDTYSPAEVERLQSLPLPDGHLMTILFESGIRKAEARHLRPADFKPEPYPAFPHGKLVILDGKGGKDRVIPCSQLLARALSELAVLEAIDSRHYYWYGINAGNGYSNTVRNRVMAEGVFHRWWVRSVEAAGVRYLKPHTTRHTFATTWRRRGLEVDEIQMLLGHSSVSTTADLYVHTEVQDVGTRMAEIVGSEQSPSATAGK